MQVITANSLADGRVVFQTPTGWSHDINRADVLDTPTALDIAMTRANLAAAQNRVVEPYAIDVTRAGPDIMPTRLRERIRVGGPTTGNSTASAHDEAA
jgi:hypothetical protein